MARRTTGHRKLGAPGLLSGLARIPILTAALFLSASGSTKADECGSVTCTDVTTEHIIRVMNTVMIDMKTDCRSVQGVKLLDKSVDDIMMIYHVRCDDGAGIHLYQLFYWANAREVTVFKFSGTFKISITKTFPTKIGLEARR